MEDVALPVAFALGFLSGFKHAFEPDHVVAVSTLLHREPKLARALRTGLAWGAGHTTTLMLALPFLAARPHPVFYNALTGLSGGLSILLGAGILYAIGT